MKLSIVFLLVFSLLPGCNQVKSTQQASAYEDAVTRYAASLRWGRFEDARTFHRSRAGETPAIDIEKLEQIRVTGHTIRKKSITPELDAGFTEVELKYYGNDSVTIKKLTFSHHWWYDDNSKRWFIESGFPIFK